MAAAADDAWVSLNGETMFELGGRCTLGKAACEHCECPIWRNLDVDIDWNTQEVEASALSDRSVAHKKMRSPSIVVDDKRLEFP